MGYRFQPGRSVIKNVRRIAGEQIDKAQAEIADASLPQDETVHQVRKRCKKLRGLMRLIRPGFEKTYQRENACFRDAARKLSSLRDADVMTETYDLVLEEFADQLDRSEFGLIRRKLTERRNALAESELDLDERLSACSAELHAAKDRLPDWKIDDSGFDAIGPGLEKTYGRAHRAMSAAYADPSPEAFHEWRKRCKYHWYHLRLLEPAWPDGLKGSRKAAKQLSDLLGDAHDLAVLSGELKSSPQEYGDPHTLETFLSVARLLQNRLRAAAKPLGGRLFAESPPAFGERMGGYWNTWIHSEKASKS